MAGAESEGPEQILVPVNGSDLDQIVMELAATAAKAQDAELIIVYVIAVPRSLPLDAEFEVEESAGQRALDGAERIADEAKVDFTSELLQARSVGAAIVDEAIDRAARLVLMGVTHRERYGEFYLGQTVPYVLQNALCRVWIVRGAKDIEADS